MATPKTILIVSGDGGIRPPEPIANEVITPGCLMKYVGLHTNSQMKVGLHASAGGTSYPLFALEADYSGVSGSATARIDSTYASGDQVHAYVAERGARIYAFLASGQSVSAGDKLVPANSGQLRKYQAAYDAVAVAVETVDASSAAKRITVEVL